jgi:hypothetical protein
MFTSTALSQVAKANIVSPSSMVCAGRSVRASASCAIWATLVAWALSNLALVATTAMTVLPPAASLKIVRPVRVCITLSVSAKGLVPPSLTGPRLVGRAPAMICPVPGSSTSPNALTATMAPTRTPPPISRLAVPRPDFIAPAIPNIFPIVAPVPAPTLPSATGPPWAVAAAV